ncbi:hypothetical protein [Burkholderia gladioli]|uniref:hypothetical protein n=1 Tax=Burkholderia gladioli TaxID=28095 RepID=UPI002FE024BE
MPAWTHTRKIAALGHTHRLDGRGLLAKLASLDERVGMPFVWFFYGVHGNLVRSGQMERVLEAAALSIRTWTPDASGHGAGLGSVFYFPVRISAGLSPCREVYMKKMVRCLLWFVVLVVLAAVTAPQAW